MYTIYRLPIVGEMYEEFIPTNKLIMDKKIHASLRELFCIWVHLFTKWVQEFILEHLCHVVCKNLNVATEDFEDWGYRPNPEIDDDTYLSVFLATWISGKILVAS